MSDSTEEILGEVMQLTSNLQTLEEQLKKDIKRLERKLDDIASNVAQIKSRQ